MKMRVITIKYMCMVMLLLLMGACRSPKKEYLNSFETFVVQVETNGSGFTAEDWDWADEQYENYESLFPVYQSKMKQEEIAKVATLETRYLNAKPKSIIDGLLESIGGSELDAAASKIIDGLSTVFEGVVEGADALYGNE